MRNLQLKEDELILHVERASLLPSVPLLLLGVFLTVLPFFFLFPFLVFGVVGLIPPFLIAGLGVYLVWRVTSRWRGTGCVLTNKRIIACRQVGLIDQRVHAASLKQINDVAYRRPGMTGGLLQLGSVRVLFRGVVPTMHFERIRRPEVLHDIITELKTLDVGKAGAPAQFERIHLDVRA